MEQAIIELEHVRVTWQSGRRATDLYQDLSIKLQEGELYTIMGKSGSGKSTLLNLIAGFVRPAAGRIKVSGRNILQLSDQEICRYRNRSIGFIFQSFNLIYEYTVLENVMAPMLIAGRPAQEAKIIAQSRLEELGMQDKCNAFPASLSGGQQQRTAIARALVMDPPIILADEPTGNLDEENSACVMKELEKLHERGKTILLVTHDPEIGARGTRQIHMDKIS